MILQPTYQMATWQWWLLVSICCGKVPYCPSEQIVHPPDGIECCCVVQTRKKGHWERDEVQLWKSVLHCRLWDCIEHDQHARPALVLRRMKGSEIIGEIQAATNGDVFCWAWISGHNNRTDGLTRGRTPDELNKESHWWNGPLFCTNPYKTTGASSVGYRRKNHSQGGKWSVVWPQSQHTLLLFTMKDSLTSIRSFELIVARLKNIARSKTFHAGIMPYCALHQKEAEDFIVRDVQKSIHGELKKGSNKEAEEVTMLNWGLYLMYR